MSASAIGVFFIWLLEPTKILARRPGLNQTLTMPKLIPSPTRIAAAGTKPKIIEEFIGRVNSGDEQLSIAHMRSPEGWVEPGQTPEFEEYTVVLRGQLHVAHRGGTIEVRAGQAIVTHAGEWIQYSTPGQEGAEYIAVCLPGFSPQTVHRDA
jgi:mannose-6-phosphate isomerase-like protein (cupin superfamily)